MVVTIGYANKAKEYKEQTQLNIRKINLADVIEKLKRIQDEVRELPLEKPIKRGFKPIDIIKTIKKHFDSALNLIASDSLDSDIRELSNLSSTEIMSYKHCSHRT
jgi:hypothetical protein